MDVNQEALEARAATLGQALAARGWWLATAESCTGGWVAQTLTAVAGSSAWFDRGLVTYSNAAKMDLLGVRADTLAAHGAVSEATVAEMAEGLLARAPVQATLAISGIAGPGGATPGKPVGLVCFAWGIAGQPTTTATRCFAGDRRAVRAQSVAVALDGLLARLAPMP